VRGPHRQTPHVSRAHVDLLSIRVEVVEEPRIVSLVPRTTWRDHLLVIEQLSRAESGKFVWASALAPVTAA
jgi:hypothetical protein